MVRATGWSAAWIANPWIDLAFMILTPALVIPLIAVARTRFTAEEIALYVTAFGATGHHLPGLLRAYGDRELFERYRIRFLVAPVLLISACVAFSYWNLQGLLLIGVTWGVWHSLMQVYGFLRIYDGKVRSIDPITARLDFLVCFGWFLWGFLNSSGRQAHWMDSYLRSGGIPLAFEPLRRISDIWGACTIAVTIAFLGNLVWRWQRGAGASPLKLLSLVISIAFWWYAMVLIDNPLLSAALFEIFHDVQYLTIVWIFNRGRAAKSEHAGSFTRFLFRRSGAMVGLYLALVFGYGIVGLSPDLTNLTAIKPALYGLLLASGLLHFYYDGFIWKLRDSAARTALDLRGDAAAASWTPRLPSWASHSAKWLLVVVPAALLAVAQLHSQTSRLEQLRWLVASVPNSWNAHHLLASEFLRLGNVDEAIPELQRAIELSPRQARVHLDLGQACQLEGDSGRAINHYARAVELEPGLDAAARALCELLASEQRNHEAETQLRRLLTRLPNDAELHHALGSVLAARGKTSEAAERFRYALELRPSSSTTHNNLGLMLLRQGKADDAARSFEEALRLDPEYAEAYNNRAVVFARQGDIQRANEHYRQAIRLAPADYRAMNSLAWNLATATDDAVRNGPEALQLAELLTRKIDAENAGYWTTLSAALAEVKRFDEARQAADHALQLSLTNGDRGTQVLAGRCQAAFRQDQPYRDLRP